MADGLGGPPQGFGETIFDATKQAVGQQVKSTVQAVGQQVTGKPIGQSQSSQSGTFQLPKAGGAQGGSGQMPVLDQFGDFGKLFEKNQLGGKKQPPVAPSAQSQNKTTQQLEEMQDQQTAIDAQKIAQLTQELHQLYAKKVMDSGEEALKKQQEYMENLRKEQEEKWASEKDQQEVQNGNLAPIGQMQSGQLTQAPVTQADRSGEAGKHTG